MSQPPLRHLVVVLGDQLDLDAAAFDGFDAAVDVVWMAEVAGESTRITSGQPRTALFLSAMRHFAQALRAAGRPLHYRQLDDADNTHTLASELQASLAALKPEAIVLTAPGDWQVWQSIKAVAKAAEVPVDVRDDRHFYATVREFAAHAQGRKQLRLEYWYRELRQRHGVLMQRGPDGAVSKLPVGDQWNFDADNRAAFGRDGPGLLTAPVRFAPDDITQEVIRVVRERFPTHPGDLDAFDWPVTRDEALRALSDFIDHRLPLFGQFQDAIWPGEPWLYHSRLAAAMNLKLLNPREVVNAAEAAFHSGHAPLPAVEGFIRQILGWREYVRGIYWTQMPAYAERNALEAHADLPGFYWTGDTPMACLKDAITQTLQLGYAHHIQRLMVTGLYALLLGVRPQQVHEWYLGVYVDAVEWVELPNVLGMSQFADGGLMASKPYAASGAYIARQSPLCNQCRFKPTQSTGDAACPFTVLYWDFVARHEDLLARNPRTVMQVRNLARKSEADRAEVAEKAQALREGRWPKTDHAA
ncbi:MAG: cryptochrome/photolyase family protein [Burkholderiales bacterium PBB6]|nr:MAG: cryptochrome/photolyase family protein [Burkholderiales bacterium PBB6]